MKIRTDFVTNSSSSSFVCFGIGSEKFFEDLNIGDTYSDEDGEDCEYDGNYDKLERVLDVKDSPFCYGGPYDYESVGITVNHLERNCPELKFKDIREFVANEFNRVFGLNYTKDDIQYIEEGWMDN